MPLPSERRRTFSSPTRARRPPALASRIPLHDRGADDRHGIIAVLATIALPLATFAARRNRETQLHDRLQKINWAIDKYAELRGRGVIKTPADTTQGLYPKTLEEMTKSVELIDGKKLVLLRERDLIDPMTKKNDWSLRSSTDDASSVSTNNDNVWDVHSSATGLVLDGKMHYNEW